MNYCIPTSEWYEPPEHIDWNEVPEDSCDADPESDLIHLNEGEE